ncbi:MAG TPA: hypothetical protein VN040_01785 [Pseudosphingobacterium sp.]|nr:hypothetical protein [Pseudosphingobacterium sp.]
MILNTIANLKTTAGTSADKVATVLGYNTIGDGGGGNFYWDVSSTSPANDGIIFQVTGVTIGRWLRQYDGYVNVKWFGAIGNGLADDTLALQRAIDTVAPYIWKGNVNDTKYGVGYTLGYLTGLGKFRITAPLYINPFLTIRGERAGGFFDQNGGFQIIADFDARDSFILDTAPFDSNGIRTPNKIASSTDFDGNLFVPVVCFILDGLTIYVPGNRNIKGCLNRCMAMQSHVVRCSFNGANIGIQTSCTWGGSMVDNQIVAKAIGVSNRAWVTIENQTNNYVSILGTKPTPGQFDYPPYDGNMNEGSTACVYSYGSIVNHYKNIWEGAEIGFMNLAAASHYLESNYSEKITKYVYCTQVGDLDIKLGSTVACSNAELIYATGTKKCKIDFGNISTFAIKGWGFVFGQPVEIWGSKKAILYMAHYNLIQYKDLDINGVLSIYIAQSGVDTNNGYHPSKPIRTLQTAIERCVSNLRNIINKTDPAATNGTDVKYFYEDGSTTITKTVRLDNVELNGGGYQITWVFNNELTSLPKGIQNLKMTNVTINMTTISTRNYAAFIPVIGTINIHLKGCTINNGFLIGTRINEAGHANICIETSVLACGLQTNGGNSGAKFSWIDIGHGNNLTAANVGDGDSKKVSSILFP